MENVSRNLKVEFINNYFVEREGIEILKDLKSVDFFDSGLLDSLDIIEITIKIEEEFGIKLDLSDDSTMKSMRTFEGLLNLIK